MVSEEIYTFWLHFSLEKGANFEGSERSTALSEDMLDYMIDRALNHSGQKIKRP